jgi:hypothetical protein
MNQTETGGMVERGSAQLRWALHESARLMSIWSPSMGVYFQKKTSGRKTLYCRHQSCRKKTGADYLSTTER